MNDAARLKMIDTRPYVLVNIETEKYIRPKALCHHCPATPDGKTSRLLRPNGLHDLLKAALEVQDDPAVHCLIVGLPDPNPYKVTLEDLREWCEAATKRIQNQKLICLEKVDDRFPCGKTPLCHQHATTLVEESLNVIKNACFITHRIDEGINQNFAALSPKQRLALQLYFTLENPLKKGTWIKQNQVAEKLGRTDRWMRATLNAAQKANPACFAKLLLVREKPYKAISRARDTRE